VEHVAKVLDVPQGTVHGRQPQPDAEVARWCGAHERVLVTIDADFRTRWVRSQLLASHGVEVVVFTEDLRGLVEQHRRVTAGLEHWDTTLSRDPYGFRVWVQGRRGAPKIQHGPSARRRPRPT